MMTSEDLPVAIPALVSMVSKKARKNGLRVLAYSGHYGLFSLKFLRDGRTVSHITAIPETHGTYASGFVIYAGLKFTPDTAYAKSKRAVADVTLWTAEELANKALAKKLVAAALKGERYVAELDRRYVEQETRASLKGEATKKLREHLTAVLGEKIGSVSGDYAFINDTHRVDSMLEVKPETGEIVASIKLSSPEQLKKLLDLVESPDF